MSPPLACPVRGCARPLERGGASWTCPNGHTFDVARSGYLNLLQPQDRRSKVAGDAVEAIQARSRLLAGAVGSELHRAVAAALERQRLSDVAVVVELGCGGGEFLGGLVGGADRVTVRIGIDLATAAAAAAARAFPALTWVVANADRRLPLLDASVDAVVSIHARRNPAECARILKDAGRLIIAVPGADDLVELREAVFGRRVERGRTDLVIAEHSGNFTMEERLEQREQLALTASQLDDLLTGTYRGKRRAVHERRAALAPMTVTLASEILVFRRRARK